MNMSLTFECRLRQTFECPVCKQMYDEDKLQDDSVQLKLFGAESYFVRCCNCGRAVDGWKDRAYQRRWVKKAWPKLRARLAELKKLIAERQHETQAKEA